jgi:hypothetical protein
MAEEMRTRTNWGNILDTGDYTATTDLGFERPGDTDETWLAPADEAMTDSGQEGQE